MRKEAKRKALNVLSGNWGMAILVTVVYVAVFGLCSSVGILALLFSSVLLIGLNYTFIHASIFGKYQLEDLFVGFTAPNLANKVILSVLKNIYIFLWGCLFVIPGIVKSYSYKLAEYISLQHPEYTATQCIDESRKLMDGHKWDMFVLDLSFIGWAFLCVFTFGIGYLFLSPYKTQTEVEFINANIMKLKDDTILVNE